MAGTTGPSEALVCCRKHLTITKGLLRMLEYEFGKVYEEFCLVCSGNILSKRMINGHIR